VLPSGSLESPEVELDVGPRLVEDPTSQDLQFDDGTRVVRESFSAVAVDGEQALVHSSGYWGRRCGGGSSMLRSSARSGRAGEEAGHDVGVKW